MLFIIILCNLFVNIIVADLPNYKSNQAELDASHWEGLAKKDLFDALHHKDIKQKAKNIILFLGDGMGITTITPSRILKGQLQKSSGEETKLAFEDFPNTCLIKTYNVNYQVPDSAGTATAFLSGVKTNKGVLGVNARVKYNESKCDVVKQNMVTSIFKLAHDQGMKTGVVTTTRVTHATPAAAYASSANRDWEGNIPSGYSVHPTQDNCKDIGRQLVENNPGKNLNVILGGGVRYFYPQNYTDPISKMPGKREDGMNLVEKWLDQRRGEGLKPEQFKFVNTRGQLLKLREDKNVDHLLGIFSHSHMTFDKERDSHMEPSLADMAETAIKVLQKGDKGFMLLVEGGMIDRAHHKSYANLALYETLAFDRAIERALQLVNIDETLVVVTADHSHAFTMNGYPKRGHNIMGIAGKDEESGKPFTTLMYANGPGHKQVRGDTLDTSSLRYQSYTGVFMESAHHGGEDVALYSIGPMSHLFRGTKEQSYVAHVMEFAACLGPYRHYDHCIKKDTKTGGDSSASVLSLNSSIYLFIALIFVNFFLLKLGDIY